MWGTNMVDFNLLYLISSACSCSLKLVLVHTLSPQHVHPHGQYSTHVLTEVLYIAQRQWNRRAAQMDRRLLSSKCVYLPSLHPRSVMPYSTVLTDVTQSKHTSQKIQWNNTQNNTTQHNEYQHFLLRHPAQWVTTTFLVNTIHSLFS